MLNRNSYISNISIRKDVTQRNTCETHKFFSLVTRNVL